MPVYQYRREDGTSFEVKQSFNDEPLTVDPVTGQKVVRVVQSAGIIFKGSGFYVNDSKNASKSSLNGAARANGHAEPSGENGAAKPEKAAESTPKAEAASAKEPAAAK